jgi:hypothetical protein
MEQENQFDGGINSANEATTEPKPIPNAAAASDVKAAPPVPINPDDLHDLFQGSPSGEGLDDEDPLTQLRNDPNYSALIRDLQYIAEAARELFATAEEEAPSDEVWNKIKTKLETDEPEADA